MSNELPQNPAFLEAVARRKFSLRKLIKAKQKYELEIDTLYKKIERYVEFKFFIMYQPSDGFVIVHYDNQHNAPLSRCIAIIEDKAKLSYKDYLRECI
jgi:hypothetical protein